jgi:hypothetical protein
MAVEYTESIEKILKDVLGHMPGVVRSVAARETLLVMREFFEKSFAWTDVITNIAIPAGNTAIQLDDSDGDTTVVGILRLEIGTDADGYEYLRPLGRYPDKIESTNSTPWGWYVSSSPDEIFLHPYPESIPSKVLRAHVALMPAEDVDVNDTPLPRQVYLRYYDAILDGVLARLYLHPSKSYSQPMLGERYRQKFLKAIGYYAAQRKKGYNNSPMWTYPRGWSPTLRQRYG